MAREMTGDKKGVSGAKTRTHELFAVPSGSPPLLRSWRLTCGPCAFPSRREAAAPPRQPVDHHAHQAGNGPLRRPSASMRRPAAPRCSRQVCYDVNV